MKDHELYNLEFQEQGLAIWAFLRTWDGDNFRRVVIGVLDRFESDAIRELSVVGSVVAAVGSSASAVAISGGLMFFLRHMHNTWAVGTQRHWLSNQFLTCG